MESLKTLTRFRSFLQLSVERILITGVSTVSTTIVSSKATDEELEKALKTPLD